MPDTTFDSAVASNATRGAALHLHQVGKAYGTRQVLHDVDLHVTPGEFVAIVGRSGCGKSTLLRVVAGLEPFQHGTLDVAGHALPPAGNSGANSEARADTRIMFQDARLLPWKRVIDNVALGLPPERRPAARGVLEQVGLGERGGDWPARLSGGQRQRVALARALAHSPRLLLLDEPLGALDALTRIEMHALIEQLWLSKGFTALLVTHDVQEAVALADRVLLVEDGRITLDQRVDLPRPRQRGDARFAELEQHILSRVLQQQPPVAAEAPRTRHPHDNSGGGDPATAWAGGLRWAI